MALVGVSMPIFWLGLVFMLVFSIQLGWLPISGRLGVEFIPVLSFGHGLQVNLDLDLGQHGDNGFGDFFIVDVAVVGGNHGALKAVGQPGLLHQCLGFFEIIARNQRRGVAHIPFWSLLTGRCGRAFHDLFDDAFIVDGVDNGLTDADILEFSASFLVQLNGDNPAT